MVPTVPWIKQKFAEFNRKYFGGKLPTPRFALEPMANAWGKYDINGASFSMVTRRIINLKQLLQNGNYGIITLTNQYSRNEVAVCNTLLHEMCHMYVYLVMGVYPKDIHGKEFASLANNIKGFGDIVAENPFTDDDVEGGTNGDNGCILGVIEFQGRNDVKWWVCRVNPNELNTFYAKARGLKDVKAVNFYDCESNALYHVESGTKNFFGWGGMVYRMVAQNIANYCGESDLHVFMPEQIGGTMVPHGSGRNNNANGQNQGGNGAAQQQQQQPATAQINESVFNENDIRTMVSETLSRIFAKK